MWCSILATDLLSKEAAHLSTVGHERKLGTQKGKSTDGRKKSIIIRGHHFLQSYILLLNFNESNRVKSENLGNNSVSLFFSVVTLILNKRHLGSIRTEKLFTLDYY